MLLPPGFACQRVGSRTGMTPIAQDMFCIRFDTGESHSVYLLCEHAGLF
jgi:hypothetical protein